MTFSVGKREIVESLVSWEVENGISQSTVRLDKVSHGKITLEGKVLNIDSPLGAIKQGLDT